MTRKKPSFFPSPHLADENGLVATTLTMNVNLLLDAYSHGLFPWSSNPVGWFSPDPRAIFIKGHIRLPSNLEKIKRKNGFNVTFDKAFEEVIHACAKVPRDGGTWISEEFIQEYVLLHAKGNAHSVEVWKNNQLVGGLYGVQIGGFFAGESMFYTLSNASKVAFEALMIQLDYVGVHLIDAQVINEHTAKLGAYLISREDYLPVLEKAIQQPVLFDGEHWPSTFTA